MRLLSFVELRKLINVKEIDMELLVEGFKLVGNTSPSGVLFTTMDTLQLEVEKYCRDKGWEVETTLVLYEPPRTKEEQDAYEKTLKVTEDWDDIQIGMVDNLQVIATLYDNLTVERFIKILTAPVNLRAFL